MGIATKQNVEEPIERIAWAASTMKPRKLPASVLRGLWLHIILTTTNTGGAALTAYDLAKAVNKFRIVLNGQDTKMRVPGYHLYMMNYYDFSHEPQSVLDTNVGTGKTQKLFLYLPEALVRAGIPIDTLLDGRSSNKITSVHLEIDWAAAAIGTNVTVTSGYVNIYPSKYTGVPVGVQIARHEWAHDLFTLSSTGEVDLKLAYGGDNEYRRLFIYAFDSSGDLDDDQFDNIKVKSGSFTWKDLKSEVVQAQNVFQFSIANKTGVYIIEFPTDGLMSERIDAKSLDEFVVTVNSLVTNGTVEIVSEKYIGGRI